MKTRKTTRKAVEQANTVDDDGLGVEYANDARPKAVEWLMRGAIARDTITLIEGRKATGKTTFAASVVASATGGEPCPGWTGPRDMVALWHATEDDWESVVVPRLLAAGASPYRVVRLNTRKADGTARRLVLPDHLDELRTVLLRHKVGIMVLDPFFTLINPSLNVNIPQQARQFTTPLHDLCFECGVTCLAIRHVVKGRGGDVREAGIGGVELANAARSLLRVEEHPHIPKQLVVSVAATNYAERMPSQGFRIVGQPGGPGRIEWAGVVAMDTEELCEGRGDQAERGARRDAELVLFHVIGQEWVKATEVQNEALNANVSPITLRRAKEALLLPSRFRRVGNERFWEWGPPECGWPDYLQATEPEKVVRAGADRLSPSRPKKKRKPRRKAKGAQAIMDMGIGSNGATDAHKPEGNANGTPTD